MLSITRLGPSGYGDEIDEPLLKYLKSSDGRWHGRGAAALGLSPGSHVESPHMDAVARGYAPDGSPLCRNAGEQPTFQTLLNKDGTPKLDDEGKPRGRWTGGHRSGYALTLSAPLALSSKYASSDETERTRLLANHNQSCGAVFDYLQGRASARRGKSGKSVIPVDGLVISHYVHETNYRGGYSIHTHAVCFNVALGSDGEWSSFDPVNLIINKAAADSIYTATLETLEAAYCARQLSTALNEVLPAAIAPEPRRARM